MFEPPSCLRRLLEAQDPSSFSKVIEPKTNAPEADSEPVRRSSLPDIVVAKRQ
jgi:hypothetical protein